MNLMLSALKIIPSFLKAAAQYSTTTDATRTSDDCQCHIPEITQTILTQSGCHRRGRKIKPKGIMLHSPGFAGAVPAWFIRNWNKPDAKACVHAVISPFQIVQLLPWHYRSWGCGQGGKGSANATHVQIELCEPPGHKYTRPRYDIVNYDVEKNEAYFACVWRNACHLCAKLCIKYDISPGNIIDHAEGAKMGLASNHKDVSHWFILHGKTMNDFRFDVALKVARLKYK